MTIPVIKRKVLNKLWLRFKDQFYNLRVDSTPIVQNINYSGNEKQKKAVVCYIISSYTADWDNTNIGRTQPKEILSIVKVLIDLDFSIDIIGCNDINALPYLASKKYDLIFGFGETFYQLTNLHPSAISVYYLTEHHPDFAEKAEQDRLDYYYQRHHKRASVIRSGNFYKKHHITKKYDYLLTMSELEPWQVQYDLPIGIFPTGLINKTFEYKGKDHHESKKHFLWFGSYGAIHKGLDILFDIFKNRNDVVLHIGGFYEIDRKILPLPKRDNIIDHGYIDVNSTEFLEIVQDCSFCILPSCSEGFSTSISTTMLHGLIPVVMKDTGFNRLGNNVLLLDDYEITYFDNKITELANIDDLRLKSMSQSVYEFARKTFTNAAYESKIRKELKRITSMTNND